METKEKIAKELHKENIFNNRGSLILNREFILSSNVNILHEIFSNFFPIAINQYHVNTFYDSIEYIGVSPYFEQVEEGCLSPRYRLTLHYNEDGTVKFDGFTKEDAHNLF